MYAVACELSLLLTSTIILTVAKVKDTVVNGYIHVAIVLMVVGNP